MSRSKMGGFLCGEDAVQMYQSDLSETDERRVTFVKGKDGKLLPALPALPDGADPAGYVLTIDVDGNPAWLPNMGSAEGVASVIERLENVEHSDDEQNQDIAGMQTDIERMDQRIDDIAGAGDGGTGGELGLDGRYLRKDQEDYTDHEIKFRDGIEVGYYTGDMITDTGGKIDEDANAVLTSLKLREFLEVPEFRFNKIDVISGETWNTVAYGLIADVDRDNRVFTVKLEEGEIHGLQVHDLCRGIWHNTDTSQNWDGIGSSTDEAGFEKTQGFSTSYFRVTGLDGEHRVFYELKPGSVQHPAVGMKFAVFGHTDDAKPERQCSVYSTRAYVRYLRGVNTWQIMPGNITAQFGDLSNLHIDDGTPEGIYGTPGSIYLNNVYFGGSINNVNGLMSALNGISPYTVEGVPPEIYRNADSDTSCFDDNGNYIAGSLSFVVSARKGTQSLSYSPASSAGLFSVTASAGGGATFNIVPGEAGSARVVIVTWTAADVDVTVNVNCEGLSTVTRTMKLGMIFNGSDGASAYRLYLTNETDTVLCDVDGNPIAGIAMPSTTAHLFLGQQEVTDPIFFWEAEGCTINGSGDTRWLTSITADAATVTVRDAATGLTAVMTVKKIRNGENPVRWTLLPSANEIKSKHDGTCIPSVITCEAFKSVGGGEPELTAQGKLQYRTSDNPTWSDYTDGGVTVASTWDWIEFRLTNDDGTVIYDRERVLILEDGDTPYNMTLTDEISVIPCDADGNPLPDIQMPETVPYLYMGIHSIPAQFSWEAEGCTIANTGAYHLRLISITAELATVTIRVTSPDIELSKVWTITKNRGISGAVPVSWKIGTSAVVIRINKSGSIMPASISCRKLRAEGAAGYTETTEGCLQYSLDGNAWNTYNAPLSPQASWTMLYLRLLNAQGGTVVYDSIQIPVLNEGLDGKAPLRIYRAAISAPPRPADNTASPAGWSFTPVAAEYPNVLWMSEALFYTAGTLVNAVNTWSTPVQVSGDRGQDGNGMPGPAMAFMGEYSASETYVGSNELIMMVKQGTLYYMTMTGSGTFSNISPSADVAAGDGTTGSKWKRFSGNYKSVATELLLAESALIAGWKFEDGVLKSQGGAGLVILDGRATSSDGDDPSNTDPRIAIGKSFAERRTAPFRVYEDGTLYASDAHLSGEINATSGNIGGFEIYEDTDAGVKVLRSVYAGNPSAQPAYIEITSMRTAINIGGKKDAQGQDYGSIYTNNTAALMRLYTERRRVNPPNYGTINDGWYTNMGLRIDAKRETVDNHDGGGVGPLIEFVPVTQGVASHMVGGLYVQGNCLLARFGIRYTVKDGGSTVTETWRPEFRFFMVTDTFLFQIHKDTKFVLPSANEVINGIDQRVNPVLANASDDNYYSGVTEYTIINKGVRDSYNSENNPTARTQNGSNSPLIVCVPAINSSGSINTTNVIYKGNTVLKGVSSTTTMGIEVLPGEVLKLMCTQNGWYVSGGYGTFTTKAILL